MEFLTEPVSHDEAADFIKSKPAVTRAVFDKLLPELKARAFTVAGLEQANELQAVRDLIAEIPQGGDWDKIKLQIAAQISPYFVDPDADPEEQALQAAAGDRRAELLLRLHGFQAYSAAAYRALDEQRDVFPYWQYKSMGDGKVRHTHRALHDVALPAGDPFWNGHYPPWEWGCRCQVVGLMDIDVEEIRAADKDKPLEKQRIIEGEARKQLVENGRLVKGPTEIFDVRTPVQKGKPGAFAWNPADLRISLADLKSRYDAPVWDAFEAWAKNTGIPEADITVWEWLGGKEPNPAKHLPVHAPVGPHQSPISGSELPSDYYPQQHKPATLEQAHEIASLPTRPEDKGVDPADARRIGRFGQRLLRTVYGRLHSQVDTPPPEAINGAEIAAAVSGTKPLFHEQLSGNLALLSGVLQAHLPPGVVAARIPGSANEVDHLVVYRPEAIARVFDSDPAFYRPNGEDDVTALRLAVESHSIGELLGYGQRTMFEPGSVRVLFKTRGHAMAGFNTRPELADKLIADRRAEYQRFFNRDIDVEKK